MRSARRHFTLTELAVVLAIIGILLSSTLFGLGAHFETRNRNDTQRRLEKRKSLLAFRW